MVRSIIGLYVGTAKTALRVGGWAVGQGVGLLRGGGQAPADPAPVVPDPQVDPTPKDLDDVTIARKVESVIFRGPDRPKDSVDVNVVDGVVWLRGVAQTPELINQLEAETRALPEVVEVQNLLHLPNTPAPTRTDTPPEQRKTRRKGTAPARPRTEPRSLNADKTIAKGEPLPEDLAKERKGRPPAPLGSQDDGAAQEADGATSPRDESP